MLQEAKNDPPEPGNLNESAESGTAVDPSADQLRPIHHQDQLPHQHPQPPLHSHRNEETYPAYLMLATMLKYLNNGNAFSENCLED